MSKKFEFVGWVPVDESAEATMCWIDPSSIMHADKSMAVEQWGQGVKRIKITIDVSIVEENVTPPTSKPSTVSYSSRKQRRSYGGRRRAVYKGDNVAKGPNISREPRGSASGAA